MLEKILKRYPNSSRYLEYFLSFVMRSTNKRPDLAGWPSCLPHVTRKKNEMKTKNKVKKKKSRWVCIRAARGVDYSSSPSLNQQSACWRDAVSLLMMVNWLNSSIVSYRMVHWIDTITDWTIKQPAPDQQPTWGASSHISHQFTH